VNSIRSKIKVNILNLQKKIPVGELLLSKIRTVVRQTILSEAAKGTPEISLCLVDDKKMRQLNRRYFAKNTSTDVIAFNTGDIAVSTDTAVINSRVFKTAPLDELLLYVIHGTLHILGYDDKTARGRAVMENKSAKILKNIRRADVHT
jgi:probable rRNA maturation factor